MVPSNAGALGRRGGGAVGAARRVVVPYEALRVAWRQVAGRMGAVLAASFFFFSLALANGDCYNEISTSFVGEKENMPDGVRRWKAGVPLGKTVAIVNQKGGVGKTTTCVNLCAGLAEEGKRVLLCDFDPQANSTSGMGVDKSVSLGIYDVLVGNAESRDVLVKTRWGDVLPSNKALAGAGVELLSMEKWQFLLKDALSQVAEDYDFLLIDCPPSLELMTINALCAADSILVPVQGEYFALEGLSDLMNTVRIVRRSLNPQLELEGVLLTMFDGRTNLALQVAEEVKRYFPGKVYATVIPRNVRLSEAPSHGKPIFAYDRSSRGAEAYGAFAREFLRKNQG